MVNRLTTASRLTANSNSSTATRSLPITSSNSHTLSTLTTRPPPYGQYQYAQPQLAYVSVGPRFLALLIDGVLIAIVSGLLSLLFRNAPGATGGIVGVLAIAYFIVMEATQGATLGKMALGLRVVKRDGSPISWSESVIRNLLRIVDGLFAYLVGAILIWSSPLRQRLGDRVAKTVVVRRRG